MLSHVNTEHEIRLVTDSQGLNDAENWLLSQAYLNFGSSKSIRSHYYYDVPTFLLGKQTASLRQSVGKFSYCLKYVVDSVGDVITRREVFSRLGQPLDLLHPFHRCFGISVRLLALLGQDHATDFAAIKAFLPRVRIDCSRRYRLLTYPDGVDRLLAVAFDTVSAFDISR